MAGSTTPRKKDYARRKRTQAKTLRSAWWSKRVSFLFTPGESPRSPQRPNRNDRLRKGCAMAVQAFPIHSDPTLLAEIRRYGRFDTAGCYQCGSCTLSCDLVENSVTFPRRSIRYALLGLRAPLVAS